MLLKHGLSPQSATQWRLWLRLYGRADAKLDQRCRRLASGVEDPYSNFVDELCQNLSPEAWESLWQRASQNFSLIQRLPISAVLFRLAITKSQVEFAARMGTEYESLSLYASQGRSDDVFGLLRSVHPHVQSAPPVGMLRRGRKLLSFSFRLGARLGWGRVASLIFSTKNRTQLSPKEKTEVFDLLSQTLGELHGPLMKVGQIIGYFAMGRDDVIAQCLQGLSSHGSAMSFSMVRHQVEASLGFPLETLFRTFDFEATGVGSVAQVHRATLRDGREVAVKVLFPKIKDIIADDIAYLDLASPLLHVLAPHIQWRKFFREIYTNFSRESDLRREAALQTKLAELYADHNEIMIPKVYTQWSSREVLVMDFMRGKTLREFTANASAAAKDLAGHTITHFALSSARHGLFNSDPNPGNYLFQDDGRVIFLDFGSTVEWTPELAKIWAEICASATQQDFGRFTRAVHEGFAETPIEEKKLRPIFEIVAPPLEGSWWSPGIKAIDRQLLAGSMERLLRAVLSPQLGLQMNPRFILGMRIYFGHMSVVAALGAQNDWHGLIRENVDPSAADA
jgi:predicted unusual protein kinase regulating ubiquinone biosynthesis (AarF/ABC1/UbiB family)